MNINEINLNIFLFKLLANVKRLETFTKNLTHQVIVNGHIGVDSFMVISGFLASYMFLKELQKRNNTIDVKMIILYFIRRILRLTPLLGAVIAFYVTILPRIRRGPGDLLQKGLDGSGDVETCKKYWWRNLLYIQNLFIIFDGVNLNFNTFFFIKEIKII